MMLQIKELIREKGLTGKDLAAKLNMTENAFSLIVNGKRQPRYETLKEIANALDVDIRELFEPTKQVEPNEPIYIKRNEKYFPIGEINSLEISQKYNF